MRKSVIKMDNILWTFLLTLTVYLLLSLLQRKTRLAILNPLLFSSIVIILFLLLFNIEYEKYEKGTEFITFLIKPATVSLAIPMYQNMVLLKDHFKKIIITIFIGVFTHASLILLFAYLFNFDNELIATFIPKSLTTAVAIGVSESLGGLVYLTISIVIITGIIGLSISDLIFKILNINSPIAKGLSLGISSHALGTSKASIYGNVEASVATLSLILTSIFTVLLSPLFYKLIVYLLN